MPSRAELSKIMKGAGYSVPNATADQMSGCVEGLKSGGTYQEYRNCEANAMGNKHITGSVGASFASKWS